MTIFEGYSRTGWSRARRPLIGSAIFGALALMMAVGAMVSGGQHQARGAPVDSDGDTWSDADEVLYGSNPFDSDSTPEHAAVPGTCSDGPDNDRDGFKDMLDPGCGGGPVDSDGDGWSDVDESFYGSLPGDRFSTPEHAAFPFTCTDGRDNDLDLLVDAGDPGCPAGPVDSDGDGLSDDDERFRYGTNPFDRDTDRDGLMDGDEVFRYRTDPLNPDTDRDGLMDGDEVFRYGTNPLDPDTDRDGLMDGDEVFRYGTNPLNTDSDADGLNDGDEVSGGTNPNDADSDDDGLNDGDEVAGGTDPNDADSDGDGLNDGDEVAGGTNPNDADSDDDGLNDGDEVAGGTNPNDADSDDDGLSDGYEVNTSSTDPNDEDSDDDTLPDGAEVNTHGTNPNAADTEPDGLPDAYEVAHPACLLPSTADAGADPDGDALTNAEEALLGTDPCVPQIDYDGDGCSNIEERGPLHGKGGQRDPLNRWDFFDVGRRPGAVYGQDQVIDLQDMLLVLKHFGHSYNGGAYVDAIDNDLDRFVPNNATHWRTAESNTGVDLNDVLAAAKSFGDNCSAAP